MENIPDYEKIREGKIESIEWVIEHASSMYRTYEEIISDNQLAVNSLTQRINIMQQCFEDYENVYRYQEAKSLLTELTEELIDARQQASKWHRTAEKWSNELANELKKQKAM